MCEYHLVVVGIVSRLGASFVFSNFLPRYPPQNPLLLLFTILVSPLSYCRSCFCRRVCTRNYTQRKRERSRVTKSERGACGAFERGE